MMKRYAVPILLAILLLLTACAPERPTFTPLSPEAEAVASPAETGSVADDDSGGTVAQFAAILSLELGRPISPGVDAEEIATGTGAAKLVVTSLGLAADALLESAGEGQIDYVAVAVEKNIAPTALLSGAPLTLSSMREFARSVAQRVASGAFDKSWQGVTTDLNDDLRALAAIATIAYNPLVEGRGDFYYGDGDGNKLAYWTLTALGTIQGEMQLTDDMLSRLSSFASIRDQTNPTMGTTTADEFLFHRLLRELWGVDSDNAPAGISVTQGRVYLGHPTGDYVRQYPTAYRAEEMGDRVRVYANVVNASQPTMYAGKIAVTLRKNADALLGYQIVSIERLSDRLWKFAKAESLATAPGSDVAALVDDDLSTVWKIGSVSSDDAHLTVSFNTPMMVSGIVIYNGNHSGDQSMLERDGHAGRIGIRINGSTTDDVRLDVSSRIDTLYAGYPVVVPFDQEFNAETITIVFYNSNVKNPISISDIRAF